VVDGLKGFPQAINAVFPQTQVQTCIVHLIRKVIKNRGHFPNDDAATKLIWLALRNIAKNWQMPPITWRAANTQFAILFAERFTAHL
jgi:putative transposase